MAFRVDCSEIYLVRTRTRIDLVTASELDPIFTSMWLLPLLVRKCNPDAHRLGNRDFPRPKPKDLESQISYSRSGPSLQFIQPLRNAL